MASFSSTIFHTPFTYQKTITTILEQTTVSTVKYFSSLQLVYPVHWVHNHLLDHSDSLNSEW